MIRPPPLLPCPDPVNPPSSWPVMILYAATVLLEAEAEPPDGQLAVAWVARNRVDGHPVIEREPERVILKSVLLAPEQFSCWNPSAEGMRRARLSGIDPRRWEAAWRAACGAWWRFCPDPTGGARFYINTELARRLRPGHDLPEWYDPERVTARIGNHEFLRLA